MPDTAIPPRGERANRASPSPLVICADDYGRDGASDAVIRALLAEGRINAATCLVETEAWAVEAAALRALAEARPGVGVGLHLNLTERLGTCADPGLIVPIARHIAGAVLPARRGYEDAVLATFRRQWDLFVEGFGRPPDFIDGHEHVHLFPAARRALFRLAAETGFAGWVRQCRTSSRRPGLKRLILDPLSAAFQREAALEGLATNPGFGGLRRFSPGEDMTGLWRADLAAMDAGGLLMVHPGAASPDPAGQCRAQEARLLAELDVAVAENAASAFCP
ncbi:MAG TPA: ChbG/HpnK family deacetylase [Caulobacteraceae bacterium]|jgi:hypothetical protein|nr:ChbG/HpnK family deacetylase [Caulobacteraceae bacterium]